MTSRILYGHRDARGKRRTPRILIAVLGPALALVCAIVAAAILSMPSLQINEVAISGLATLDEAAVRERIGARFSGDTFFRIPRSSYFLADTETLGADLRAAFPVIAELHVDKSFPDGLTVAIREREFWAIMCNTLSRLETSSPSGRAASENTAPQCVAIDETGFGYAPAPRPQGGLILTIATDGTLLVPGKQEIPQALMRRLRIVRDGITSTTGLEVSGFELRDRVPAEIRVRTADGFVVFFRAEEDDFANALRVLKKVLDAEIGDRRAELEYIDARFGNKAFYKMR
ncbi:MAG: FtsQ-type POTRA domain-containing protein [Patescibacteria group bacterium]